MKTCKCYLLTLPYREREANDIGIQAIGVIVKQCVGPLAVQIRCRVVEVPEIRPDPALRQIIPRVGRRTVANEQFVRVA